MSKISQYPANTNPDNSFEFLGTDPLNTSEGPTGTSQTVSLAVLKTAIGGGGSAGGAPSAWYNVVTQYGADPTGATECHADIQSAITAAAASSSGYGVVYLPAGTYSIGGAGFTLPTNVTLVGDGSVGGTVTGVRTGTVLQVASSFTGTAVFTVTEAGNASVNGATLAGFMIYGGAFTASAVDGIHLVGPAMTMLRNIRLTQMSGWGVSSAVDLSASELGAYGQDWDGVFVDSCATVSGGGIQLLYTEDSTFRNVYVIGENTGPGWLVTGLDNCHLTDCRAEWSGASYGFYITNQTVGGTTYNWTYATGTCQFSNTSTDRNNFDGVRIDATWTTGSGSGTGPCIIMFNGLVNRRDGGANNGAAGTYAGLSLDSTNLPVVVTGLSQMTGLGDGDTGNMSPRYGVYLSGIAATTPVTITSGIAWGYTAGISGTATLLTATAVTQITGNNYSYAG